MRNTTVFLLTLFLFVGTVGIKAAEIDESLQRQLNRLSAGETVEALVYFKHRADIVSLNNQLKAERATLSERNRRVILALQEAATLTQPVVVDFLDNLRSKGLVKNYRMFWIANLFRVEATTEGIDAIATRQDLAIMYANFPIDGDKPVDTKPDHDLLTDHEIGLDRINAPAAWEQGWTGVGRVLMNIDTGVDGNHPALSDRFRGDVDGDGDVDESWFDPYDTHYPFPIDDGGHGTHTMGTICGRTPDGDTIGVAIDAQWIAAAAIDRGGGIPRTVADAILSFEWAVDPDGNPDTQDNPDAIGNSWGVHSGHGYPPCDETFWEVIDNVEFAGSAVIFSAGNEGPGMNTLRRPADRGTTPYNCFAVGAVDGANDNLPIASFSSRGPSDCGPGGERVTKPEVVAPGVNVRSSVPGGGYADYSGTSMASPHITGAVGVIRSVNPDLDVDTIKEILLSTAHDLPFGNPDGDDNTYGYGIIDLYEACLVAQSGYGFVHGLVTDTESNGIGGAFIEVIDSPRFTFADGEGHYEIGLPADTTYTLRASSFGYLPEEAQATVAPEETTIVDFVLQVAPTGSLHGTVISLEDSSAIEGANVEVADTPMDPVQTDENGYYVFDAIPGGSTYTIHVRASGFGLGQDTVFIPVDGEAELNFALSPFESFEDDNGGWTGEGIWQWGEPNSGPGSAFDGTNVWATNLNSDYPNNVDDGLETSSWVIEDPSAVMSFYHWYEIESGYDGGNVSISTDGGHNWQLITPIGGYPGQYINGLDGDPGYTGSSGDWRLAEFELGDYEGMTVEFRYRFGSDYSITASGWYIDGFSVTGASPVDEGTPIITVDPENFNIELEQGQSTEEALTIGNDGDGILSFTIRTVTDDLLLSRNIDGGLIYTEPATSKMNEEYTTRRKEGDIHIVTYDGPKSGDPKREGNPPMTTDSGGPDEFGYTWIDSDEPDGPIIEWVDITHEGQPLSFSDDENQGPFALGFDIPFYGNLFGSIYICSNGWLSFTSTVSTPWVNDPIPTPTEPNNLVAPFWDDLNPSDGGMIYFYTNDIDTAIVAWVEVPHYEYTGPGIYTFEAILTPDGNITYQYLSVEGELASNTVGIENADGIVGLQVVYDNVYVTDELAVLINYPIFWLSVDPMFGFVYPGESSDLTVTFDATEIEEGEYSGYLRIESNDPVNPVVDVECILTVGDPTGTDDLSSSIPKAFSLSQNYPNPFNPSTEISFAMPMPGDVELAIYDLLGRQVRKLIDNYYAAGYHTVTWDGVDKYGRPVSSGVYFYSIKAGSFEKTRKMIMLK